MNTASIAFELIDTGNVGVRGSPAGRFEQRNLDRTSLGLGLSFSRWGAEVNGGLVSVRNLAGHGCVFTVSLPRMPARATA